MAYVLGGVEMSAPVEGNWIQQHGRAVVGDNDAMRRVLEWGEVETAPGQARARQRLFYERDGFVEGPYTTEGGLRASHAWQRERGQRGGG